MTKAGIWFLVILILNTIFCVLFVLWGYFQQLYEEDEDQVNTRMNMTGYYIQAFIMLICPVIGPVFFVSSYLIYTYFLRDSVDLTDVIFGKDKQSLRGLMLDVVRGDVQKSLSSINLALNSEDSETSHYAATVMRDTLNDFRQTSQAMYNAMKEDYVQPEVQACSLIEFMYDILAQEVFPEMEQKGYVNWMEEACLFLYKDEEYRSRLTSNYIEWVGILLLKLREYDRVSFWCEVAKELYPYELSTYTMQLKLYFSREDKENFFRVMDELKHADVVIDRETLELIRIFQ